MSEEMSKSKKKRLAMAEARKKDRAKKAMATFWTIAIPVLILAAVVGIVFYQKKLAEDRMVDYSKYLAADGTIENINIDEYITFDYKNMSISKNELIPEDSDIESSIDALIAEHTVISEDETVSCNMGSKINISYKATIDSVSYAEVSAETGGGLDLTLGDATFSEEFDQALVGHVKNDVITVSVNYAEDYANEEIAGKTVDYEVTINGIYDVPEFNDEFVQKYLSDTATTAADYRAYLEKDFIESNKEQAIENHLAEFYTITKFPEDFLANHEKGIRLTMESSLDYYAQLYAAYGLEAPKSLLELYGMSSEDELNAMIHEEAIEEVSRILAYQYIFVHEGLTLTDEDITNNFFKSGATLEDYQTSLEKYGRNAIANDAMMSVARQYLIDNVTIVE